MRGGFKEPPTTRGPTGAHPGVSGILRGMRVPAYFTLVVGLLWAGTVVAQSQVSATESSATFNVFLRSTLIGFEQIEVTRGAAGWTIRSRGNVSHPIDLRNQLFEVKYSLEWHPVSLRIEGLRHGSPFSLSTSFVNDSATNKLEDSGQTHNLTNTISRDAVVLPEYFFGGYEVLAQRLEGRDPGDEIPIYVPSRGSTRARVDEVSFQQIETSSRTTVDVQLYRVSFLSDDGPRVAEIWADEDQRLVRISIPDIAIDVVRADIAAVGARLRTVSHAGDEDVRVQAAGFALSATVTIPVNHPRPEDGWPAVLLIPGPAAPERDGTLSGVPVLGQIAVALAESGFLVVRYDRRGVGQSGGRSESAGIEAYADDVRSMVKYLDDRDDVSRKQITVLGHAEGGWTALIAAAQERRINNLVLVGTPSTTGAELVLEQQLAALDELGVSADERTERVALQHRIIDAVMNKGPWTDVPEQMRRQADTVWFRSFLEFDAADTVRRTRQPTLVLHGWADNHVAPHHAERLTELARSRRRGVSVDRLMLEGLDQTLVETGPDTVGTYEHLQRRAVGLSLIEPLTRWLRQVP